MKTPFGHHSKLTEQLKQDRICKAAPALLEALERIVIMHGNAIGEETLLHAKRAIASAKGKE